ncbi:hypothetical protein Dimus_003754 [Dionaea muscipula]
MRLSNVGNIAKQPAMKKCVQMSVLQPSQQPLAHEGQETIKKNSYAKKLFMEKVIQECQRQDNGKQMVEKEKEQEDQTSNAMQTAHIDDQVLGSSAIHNDAGELRTDGHERDGGMKRKRMSEADIDDQVLGSSAMHNDAGELRTDEHERDGGMKRKRMLEADIGDAGELRTDEHERDDSKKGKKTRGRTMKAGIHALTEKDQKVIIMNANFQLIGPDEQTVTDFVEFLGTLSRTSSLCPLTVDKWTDMNKVYKDAKEKMWDYVKKRWVVPNGAKKWVLQTIGVLWRNFKGRLKRDHYTPYETTKMRWKNRPEDVSDEDFKFLLKKWKDPKYKSRMEELQSQQSGKSGEDAESSCSVDPFLAIMGKEHNGRVRLHGRGVTPSNLGKASIGNGSSSINVPNELLESIKADVTAQVTAELTANMMQTVTSQVAQHLCSSVSFHLKQINPLIDIDPAVLMRLVTTAPSPGDASSAPNHQSSVGLNGDSSIDANKTHFERGITSDDDEEDDEEEDDDVIDRLQ